MRRSFLILIAFIVSINSQCQDSTRYNNLSLTPASLFLDLSVSYHRVLNDFIELTVNPRFRPSYFNPKSGALIVFSDYSECPFAYNRAMIRSGFMFRYKSLFFEPIIQYDYGFRNNKWTQTGYSPDWTETLIDRHYHSIGIIGLFGIYKREGNRSFKLHYGFGRHLRYFSINYIDQRGDTYNRDLPLLKKYKEFGMSINVGVEFGRYF